MDQRLAAADGTPLMTNANSYTVDPLAIGAIGGIANIKSKSQSKLRQNWTTKHIHDLL